MLHRSLLGATPSPRKGYQKSFFLFLVVAILLIGTSVSGFFLLRNKNTDPKRTAVRYGGLEIGSKGIKAIAVEAYPDPTYGIDVREVGKSETINTTLVQNLAQTKQFDEKALKATADALKKFQERMLNEHHIPSENIYVAASSGVFAPLKGDEAAIKKNENLLRATVQEAVGKPVEFLDERREVDLSIRGSVPRKHRDESLYLDVGSGNTKGGFRTKDEVVYLELPYGTKSFRDLVKKKGEETGEPFDKQAALLREQVLEPYLQKKHLDNKQGLTDAKRNRVYLSGGVVWALATFVHPEDQSLFVKLSAEDIDAFQDMLRREKKELPSIDLGRIQNEEVRRNAEEEMNNVQGVFKLQELKAGTEVLKALSNKLDFANRKLWFARRGYLGWINAYVVEKDEEAR